MAEKKESAGTRLMNELKAKEQSAYKGFARETRDEALPYVRKYMDFMDRSKTEREFARNAAALLEENGFSAFDPDREYEAGDRVYWLNKKKSLIAAVVGTDPLDRGVLITAAHIDSPRLDLKPRPLYEDKGLAYFKTHYYGGIKKYQWAAIPLAMHGTVSLKNGEEIDLCLGEEGDDHVFYISDLLPHLARKAQGDRTMSEVLKGEELNVLLGSEPFDDEEVKEPVKLNVLKYLHDRFGMTEDDFLSAEIEIVPAMKAKFVGFDDTLVAAYGHDDKVCGYTALTALMALEAPARTCLTILADKEEIGSVGNTGLNSDMIRNFLTLLARPSGIPVERIFLASKCLSADVNAAFDPNFPQVNDPLNSAYLNAGPVISKYTGSGGKGGSNDASAEYMGQVRRVLDGAGIPWQVAELGKVDEGGGGTVAGYVSRYGIDTVDIGVALLSMHSPFEVAGTYDSLAAHKEVNAFFRNM